MRFDRLITLYAARPLLAGWRLLRSPFHDPHAPKNRQLPILMYHSISDDPETGVHDYYKLCTSPMRFAEHMQWLADWGYRGVSVTEGLAWLSRESSSDGNECKLVAITFDDGFLDNYTKAFPVLRRRGFTATIFLPTEYIRDANSRCAFKGRPCITWSEAREMQSLGIEFGSHTASHPVLVRLSDQELDAELKQSRNAIFQNLNIETCAFAYPFAFPEANQPFTIGLKRHLQENNFLSCVTTSIGVVGSNANCYAIPRLPVNSMDDKALFKSKIRGAYTWIGAAQSIIKQLKATRLTK